MESEITVNEIEETSQLPSETNHSDQFSSDEEYAEDEEEEEIEIQSPPQQLLNSTVSLGGELHMTLPLTGLNCLAPSVDVVGQEIVLISPDGNLLKIPSNHEGLSSDIGEPSTKRMCIEQDGQTYILTLQGSQTLLPSIDLSQVPTQTIISASDLLNAQEISGETSGESDVNQAWFTSREDKSNLQNKGHLWKQGMWSKDEIDLLEDNIQKYCDDRNLTEPSAVIFDMSKDERKDFYRTVAKGLNRPLFSVYRRVIRMYDNKNHVGKYTQEELEKLKKLRSSLGNDWQAIGAAMGRSASSIKDRCRLLKDNCNQGKWLPIEERQLAEAVYELANVVPGEMISSGLSWAAVSERVGTRSEKQCRTKWLNYLNWKEAGGTDWTREDDITLICRVCSLNENDENTVDWGDISKNWPSVRSPQWLRGKWWALKRHVPNANTATFPEVCDFLYQHYAQKIRIKDDFSGGSLVSAATAVVPITMRQPVRMETTPVGVTQCDDGTILRPSLATPNITTLAGFMQPMATALTTTTSTMTSVLTDMSSLLAATAGGVISVTPMIQTLGGLQQQLQLTHPGNASQVQQTFLLTHPTQHSIPMTTSVGPGQIIIHTVGDNFHMADGTTIHLNNHPQIIIGSTGGQMTSLVQSQDLSLATTRDLSSNSDCLDDEDDDDDDVNDDDDCIDGNYVETYEDDDSTHHHMVMNGVINEDDGLVNSKSNHLIMSDVMLAASRIPETMGSPSSIDHNKDSLDHIPGSSES